MRAQLAHAQLRALTASLPNNNMLLTLYDLHRIAAVPSFPGLRRFPEGRGFKQWTGDDSKALMKVRDLIATSPLLLVDFTHALY